MICSDTPFLEDLGMVMCACRGEPGATRMLTERLKCVPRMLQGLNRRGGRGLGRPELEDATQEALTAIWGKLGEYHGGARLEAWLFGFCVRELHRAVRSRHRRARITLTSSVDVAQPDEAGSAAPGREVVQAQLGRLGSTVGEIIRLKHFGSMTFEEIGARLDIPVNTAKSHYYRGLRRLRRLLQPHLESRS